MDLEPLWTPAPARVETTQLDGFRRAVSTRHGMALPDSQALHAWSVADPQGFWEEVWARLGVIGSRGDGPVLVADADIPSTRFFPGATLNVAENLLRRRGSGQAVVFHREDGAARELSWDELRAQAAAFAAFLRSAGVGPGDRVAAWMPNSPETVVAMVGSAAVGAVFTSASPDFGAEGVLDRFGQVGPKVLVAADGYVYAGKQHPRMRPLAQVVAGLPSLAATVVVGELDLRPSLTDLPAARAWSEVLHEHLGAALDPVPLPFDHPLLVLYSSGTTGKPKAIVHRAGGVLLKHLVEHRLHCDVRPGDRAFYFTTCGWMMWNWLVTMLASEATLVLYDGSPLHPEPASLLELAERERVTLFGTSAKYLDAIAKQGVRPVDTFDLDALRTITSTGSPLSPEGFAYVYDAVKPDVHLASISGGTDIVGCFVLGDPTRPVHAGEIQGPALGVAVDVLDPGGHSLRERPGVRGELVCTAAMPSMPLAFWNDPDGDRYHAAYFDRFPDIWTHGDWASWTEHGGVVIHGRSDATLNAGGVRIGTAELYRQVDQLPEVLESLAIGQAWEGDTRIVLFVRLANGVVLDEALVARIRTTLRERCSPRHVPARVVAVSDLPRTRSGKLAELAVADVVHGREVANAAALANPRSLASFEDLPALQT